jgi:hypothetical protein
MLHRKPRDFVFQVPLPRRFPKAKVGPNAPCPCGSGRKFKKCCRDAPPERIAVVPPAVVEETERRFRQHQVRVAEHAKNYGHVREAVHATFQGRKIVAVGSTLHYPRPGRQWRTFHDFLMDYVNGSFGPQWGEAEKAKALQARHPAYAMFEGWFEFQQSHAGAPGEVIKSPWTGDVASLATLAYDLFSVGDNGGLQERLLERLKHRDQYQGARYELFAAATCVRAGFSVDYEDETDGTTKHPEFIATHKKTGLKVAVEAKSRHRDGVLGFAAPKSSPTAVNEHRAGLRRLLANAAEKEPQKPYVVFLDVNLPSPVGEAKTPAWYREVCQDTLPKLPIAYQRRVNMVLCTNIAFHRSGNQIPPRNTFFSAHDCSNPEFPADPAVLNAIAEATKLFGSVPHTFPGEA